MIGKLKKLPLREIWKNEARNFTSWLSENIDTLNEALEINLSVTETEKSVGSFSLDLAAEDEEGRIVIIENQLEKTDHDHLGKLVTYLSNLEAKMAIWITGNPREEHKKAIDWLNEITQDDVSFYLVKVEAVRIEDSAPAPLFSVIAEPTEISKEIGKEKKEYAISKGYKHYELTYKDFENKTEFKNKVKEIIKWNLTLILNCHLKAPPTTRKNVNIILMGRYFSNKVIWEKKVSKNY